MNKVIGCGIDKGTWEHSINGDNLLNNQHQHKYVQILNCKKKQKTEQIKSNWFLQVDP